MGQLLVKPRGKDAGVAGNQWNRFIVGDAAQSLMRLPEGSVDLSFWSPPYFVGKSYEQSLSFMDWQGLIQQTIRAHQNALKPGAFMAVNIADILCFPDENIPRFQANNLNSKGRKDITLEKIADAKRQFPEASRHQLAAILGCSEQTIQRRAQHNNVRGGKPSPATKVMLTGCMLAEWAEEAGLYLYDKRIWHKDPCWANSQWHSSSYRAVDEFEHIYVFWKPGITDYDRGRLQPREWAKWGSRGVWNIKSVRRNYRHEAEFPIQLAERVIKLFSPADGVVVDPFVGSGTTALAAAQLGRRWVGIDSSRQCIAQARNRLKNEL